MKKATPMRLAIAVIAMCLPLIPKSVSAQEEKGKEPVTGAPKPVVAYRLEFSVREVENGKRSNSRNYMMMAEEGNWGRIRIENNVPYQSEEKNYQYRQVRMYIDCRPREGEGSVALEIHVDFSSIAAQTEEAPAFHPLIRTDRTEVQSVVTPGKPTLVATMDDVSSNRRYEIEVTATKVK